MDGPPIAPLWKRSLAAAVDGLPFALLAAPFVLRETDEHRPSTGRVQVVSLLLSGAYHISATRLAGQTLGQRTLGIQVVGEETGRRPTTRQAAVRWAVAVVPECLSVLIGRSTTTKEAERLAAVDALQPEIARLRREYGRDRQGLNRELMALYEERGVNPLKTFLPSLRRALPVLMARVVLCAPALRKPLHQAVHDRMAKTVVVVARA